MILVQCEIANVIIFDTKRISSLLLLFLSPSRLDSLLFSTQQWTASYFLSKTHQLTNLNNPLIKTAAITISLFNLHRSSTQ